MDLYEPLEVIGNGSFGIIRKVRRKSDGEVRVVESDSVVVIAGTDGLTKRIWIDTRKEGTQIRADVRKGSEADRG